MLTQAEKERYLRHILMEEVGEAGQVKLKKASVLVIGAGGLGCPVLQYLTAAGIGKIGVIDDDKVDATNLQRQVLYTEKDMGLPKVFAAGKRLGEMNSSTSIEVYNKRLSAENAVALFSEYDIVVEGSDNFTTKYLSSDAAVLTDKPLVFGSIFKFEGQVSVFNYQNGPTYRCLFPEPGSAADMPSCSEVGVLGILPGIIGSLQANEVLKIILGIGKVLSGKLLLFNALEMQTQLLPFSRSTAIRIEKLDELELSCNTAFPSLSYQDFLSEPEFYNLLDVRSTAEREEFTIGGLHIPLQELSGRYKELLSMDDLLVYCASGIRSDKAISMLKEFFPEKKMYNLKGGLKGVT